MQSEALAALVWHSEINNKQKCSFVLKMFITDQISQSPEFCQAVPNNDLKVTKNSKTTLAAFSHFLHIGVTVVNFQSLSQSCRLRTG